MEIASANGSSEVGTIQSLESFAPPLTVTALVKGTISDGHPFVFAISSSDASSGVQITGNLNPNDCSNEANCGNPATCGTPANASIPAGQCYYGIYARIGTGGGNWAKTPELNRTPSVGVVYTLQISVDSSGNAQYNVSAGGQVLGESTAQVGTGPFSIILAQSEGAPVPGPGPNQAYWLSASFTPTAPSISPPSSSGSSGLSSIEWLIIGLVAVVALILIFVVWTRRGRELTVTVLDSETLSPLTGAGVSADGPKSFAGSTGNDGRVAFGGVKLGDYSVKAGAAGYSPSVPVTVPVKRTTQHTVRLERSAPASAGAVASHLPPEGLSPRSPPPATSGTPPVPTGPSPAIVPPGPAPPPSGPPEPEETEGFAGERIREIIRTFQAKGAVSPETALTAEELGLSRLFVRIMKRRRGKTRVFVEVNGRYYLDQKALNEMK
jgi:hypothetical protein